jgi:hypothetical protein
VNPVSRFDEGSAMKCWFCDNDAKAACKACGRGVCRDHAHIHDVYTQAKSDTSTGYTSYYNIYGAIKCGECRIEWTYHTPKG